MADYTATRCTAVNGDTVARLVDPDGVRLATFWLPAGAGLFSAALEAIAKNGDRVLAVDELGDKAYLAGSASDLAGA